jgi:putative flippase GtrA
VFFVFTGHGNSSAFAKTFRGMMAFCILACIGLAIHTVGMYLGYRIIGINEWVVKIILTIVVLGFNYFTRKKFIFGNEKVAQNDLK